MRNFLKVFISAKRRSSFEWRAFLSGFALAVISCFFLASFFIFCVNTIAFAQSDDTYGLDNFNVDIGRNSDPDALKNTIAKVINIALGFLGVIAVILILYAGYMWMTAGGNEQQVAKAKLIIRNAVIGLVIIFLSWAIAWFVISRLSGATNGGGIGAPCGSIDESVGRCYPDNNDCNPGLFCNSDCRCQSSGGGGLGPEGFRVENFETTHEGLDPSKDVYLCSSVQAIFNHWLKREVFDNEVKNVDTLTIKQMGAGAMAPSVNISTVKIELRNNIISFKNRNADDTIVDWAPNSSYEVRLSKSLEDRSGQKIQECKDCIGEDSNHTYYRWIFTTGNTKDEVSPQIIQTYPSNTDINVPRSVVFYAEFSESIDVTTVTDADEKLITSNISLQKYNYTSNTYESSIVGEAFDVSFGDNEILFNLNKNYTSSFGDGYLEPYTKYKLTIKNIEDLCGNKMDGEKVIEFETGADLPGVSFVHPTDGYQYSCPGIEVFAMFKTSMFNIKTRSCEVDSTGNAGLVLGGELSPAGKNLRPIPEDNYPGTGNPNGFCKQYNFDLNSTDAADDLIANTQYTASINFINQGDDIADKQTKTWTFGIKPGDQCADEPYIRSISPNQGKWGRCMSVIGQNFGATKGSSSVVARLDLESSLNGSPIDTSVKSAWEGYDPGGFTMPSINWGDRFIASDFVKQTDVTLPLPGAEFPRLGFEVKVKVDHGDKIGVLESNAVDYILTDRTGEYTGPCLDSISPSRGYPKDSENEGTLVEITGRRLGTGKAYNNQVVFYNDKIIDSIGADEIIWTPNKISGAGMIVPEGATNNPSGGEVHVVSGGVDSNLVNFDILARVGAPCSSLPYTCSPNQSVCDSAGLECRAAGQAKECTCQPPDSFNIRNPYPSSCSDSCKNAKIGFHTTKIVDQASVDNTTVLLFKCQSDVCSESDGLDPVTISPSPVPISDYNIEFAPALSLDSSYRVVVLGGDSGLKAEGGKQLNNDNFTYQGKQAYSWIFGTGNNKEACAVNRIDISPNGGILYENSSYVYRATAYSVANSCSPYGQRISANFLWSDKQRTTDDANTDCKNNSDEPRLSMSPVSSVSTSTASVAAIASGESQSWICAQSSSVVAGAPVTLKAKCKTDADCFISASATGAVECQAVCEKGTGICMPKITGSNPQNGIIGTWVTIDGCYFGNDWGEVKIGDINAIPPNERICGNTWSNTQIIAETKSYGDLEVIRMGDSAFDKSGTFLQSSASYPAICRVEPRSSRQGTFIEIKGNNFGQLSEFLARSNKGVENVSYGVIYASSTASALDKTTDEVRENTGCPDGGWGNEHICVKVHNEAPVGNIKIKVRSNNSESNEYNFRVIGLNEIPAGAQNLYVLSYMPGAGNLACPDMVVEAFLSSPVDSSSFTPANFFIREKSSGAIVPGVISQVNSGSSRVRIQFTPNSSLNLSTDYEIVLKGGTSGLRSQSLGIVASKADDACDPLSGENCVIQFKTVANAGADICKVSRLQIEPNSPVYTCAGDNCPDDKNTQQAGHQRIFSAYPVNKAGQTTVLRSVLAWISSDTSIISVASPASATLLPSQKLFSIQPKNGTSIITAQASISGADISGSTEARVFLCENPWPAHMVTDGFPYRDSFKGDTSLTSKTNFSTFYCRDKGEPGEQDDFPEITLKEEAGSSLSVDQPVPGLIKELFFTQPKSRYCSGGAKDGSVCSIDSDCESGNKCVGKVDAIGIRVLTTQVCVGGGYSGVSCVSDSNCGTGGKCSVNPEYFSIQSWYNAQSYEGGNPKSISIDGFGAIQDGRTVYVSGINVSGADYLNGKVYKNVYLMSMNDTINSDTVAIYNQLVENWRFLANISDPNEEDKLRRDLQRLDHAYFVANLFENRTFAPKLESGSFKNGLSVSTWPSWSQALSTDFGASMPVDPVNTINCAPTTLKPTCWDNATASFFQPSKPEQIKSLFYKYEYTAPNQSVFKFNLEFGANPATWSSLFTGAGWGIGTDGYFDMKYIKNY